MKLHFLKIEWAFYQSIMTGEKKAEVRYNDRDYQKGDRIQFRAIIDGALREVDEFYEITHVLNFPTGLKENYVSLSIKLLPKKDELS